MGRPELVGTDAAYRNRGLVRKQFEVVHEWSRQRGELVQVITGIPYFYRQFGYEMGLDLSGGKGGYEAQVPVLEAGQQESYLIRPATRDDLPWVTRMHQRDVKRSMVAAFRDEALLLYEMEGASEKNVNHYKPCVIETSQGQPWATWYIPTHLGKNDVGGTLLSG